MCLHTTNVDGTGKWNWAGDDVVFDRIVPSHRAIANTSLNYDVDVRSFLTNPNNAVIRRAIDEAVRELTSSAERERFWSRAEGAFDHRVVILAGYVGRKIAYQARGDRRSDAWQFADETLTLGTGDCEDLAFLLASLLLASGISGYMVRVVLGQLVVSESEDKKVRKDHVWVMYQNELGHWLVMDPLLYFKQSSSGSTLATGPSATGVSYEYVPHFVFNDEHLWSIRRKNIGRTFRDYVSCRSFLNDFDPSFGVTAHNHIFDTALVEMPWAERQYVKASSLAVDANIITYDPRDHFDNGYVNESIQLIMKRLRSGSLSDFALVAHSIGDFYAHTTYDVFGNVVGGKLAVYDWEHPETVPTPDYGPASHCPLANSRFSVNEGKYHGSREDAANHWHGKIISGRYAQNGDPHQGAAERLTYIPKSLRDAPGYAQRAMLPHHNEIAVDGSTRSAGHRLYLDSAQHAQAFQRRQGAAIQHLGLVYARWKLQYR